MFASLIHILSGFHEYQQRARIVISMELVSKRSVTNRVKLDAFICLWCVHRYAEPNHPVQLIRYVYRVLQARGSRVFQIPGVCHVLFMVTEVRSAIMISQPRIRTISWYCFSSLWYREFHPSALVRHGDASLLLSGMDSALPHRIFNVPFLEWTVSAGFSLMWTPQNSLRIFFKSYMVICFRTCSFTDSWSASLPCVEYHIVYVEGDVMILVQSRCHLALSSSTHDSRKSIPSLKRHPRLPRGRTYIQTGLGSNLSALIPRPLHRPPYSLPMLPFQVKNLLTRIARLRDLYSQILLARLVSDAIIILSLFN